MDARVRRGMERQLARWRVRLAGGDVRVGWKIGINEPRLQRALGLDGWTVGHLTLATALVPGTPHRLAGGTMVGVEPEIAVHLGRDVDVDADPPALAAAIAGLGPALEVVDVDGPLDDVERIVAGNIFHRAVLFGVTDPGRVGGALAGVSVRVARNAGEPETADAAAVAADLPALVGRVARMLGECGERLRAGDRIISGSLTPPVWVQAGDVVEADFGPLGALRLVCVA